VSEIPQEHQAPPPPTAPPPDVAGVASAQGLGPYSGVRTWGDPREAWLMAGVAIVVYLAVAAAGILLFHPLAAGAVILLIWIVTSIGRAIAVTRRRNDAVHLFAGGVVWCRGGRPYAVPWARAARLGQSTRNRAVTGGRRFPLYLVDGAMIEVPFRPDLKDGRDSFLLRLAALLRENGRQVD
jgi:hypothetical protein